VRDTRIQPGQVHGSVLRAVKTEMGSCKKSYGLSRGHSPTILEVADEQRRDPPAGSTASAAATPQFNSIEAVTAGGDKIRKRRLRLLLLLLLLPHSELFLVPTKAERRCRCASQLHTVTARGQL